MFAFFDQCFQVAPDAVMLVDEQGTIVRANARAQSMFGYASDELIGKQVDQLIPDRSRDHHRQLFAEFMASPRPRPMFGLDQALSGRRKNGTVFPVEIALAPLQTDEGACVLASIRDVSESERTRRALLRARYDRLVARVGERVLTSADEAAVLAQLPREIAEALPADAVAIVASEVDRGPILLQSDHGLNELSPADLLEVLGGESRFAQMSTPSAPLIIDDLSADSEYPSSVLSEAGFHSILYVTLAGRDAALGGLIALARTKNGFDADCRACLGTLANLLSSMLQRRRTEEQLAHSLRLDAIGRLTGGIAHDFNNLLTVVSGNLQLIELSEPGNTAIKDMLDGAQHAVDSAAQLTGKLLTFARRQHLSPQWIDPASMLRDMGTLLRRTLGETINVDIDASTDLPPLYVDRAQLDSALLNLALNARDAMPRGGQLRIEARPTELTRLDAERLSVEPGPFLSLVVADTGLGMAAETLRHALEPFFTTKSPSEGSGLGLSMVYGFVRQSGGQVRLDSRLGYGTRVELLLPLRTDAAAHYLPISTEHVPLPADLLGNERVLVVEDDSAVRQVTVAFLHSLGYQVDDVASAEDALERIGQHADLALVLSDVVLGSGLSGVELAQQILALRPDLPVLLTSGYEHETLQQLGISAGRYDLLRKPYRREQLALVLRRLLAPTGH